MTCPFCQLPETFVEDETVYICGEHRALSPTHTRLFKLFWENRGKLTPHWMIWDAIWPDKIEPETSFKITHVQIHNLKKKIDPLKLENVTGQGYMLTVNQ